MCDHVAVIGVVAAAADRRTAGAQVELVASLRRTSAYALTKGKAYTEHRKPSESWKKNNKQESLYTLHSRVISLSLSKN